MFAVQCPECGKKRLMSLRSIVRVENTTPGCINVTFECGCGAIGTWQTGRLAG